MSTETHPGDDDLSTEESNFYDHLQRESPFLSQALYLLSSSRAPEGVSDDDWEARKRGHRTRVFAAWQNDNLSSP